MAIERIFLGWDAPFLTTAARYFCERYCCGEMLDMHNLLLALPGSRAVRRFMEVLVDSAEAAGFSLSPPRCVTAGALPEMLYTSKLPLATKSQRLAAWCTALTSVDPAVSEGIFHAAAPQAPPLSVFTKAESLDSLAGELGTAGLTFKDVRERLRRSPYAFDEERWQHLEALQEEYFLALAAAALIDPTKARLCALEQCELCTSYDIFLLACADIHPFTVRMLAALTQPARSLIFAPHNKEELFDGFGMVAPRHWLNLDLEIPLERIILAGNLRDQCAGAAAKIAAEGAAYTSQEISIGVCHDDLPPLLVEKLAECGISAHHATGDALLASKPCTLLRAAANYLSAQKFTDFGTLIRHVDMQRWLELNSAAFDTAAETARSFEACCDEYMSFYFQDITQNAAASPAFHGRFVHEMAASVDRLLDGLRAGKKSLALWRNDILRFLSAVYAGHLLRRRVPGDYALIEAFAAISEQLGQWDSLGAFGALNVSGSEAIVLLLRMLSDFRLTPPPSQGAVEILGWLELALDDAPFICITGLNEGNVPQAINHDQFLPDSFRRYLGLLHNEKRYARDAYILTSLIKSKKEAYLILGQTGLDGASLAPSRLLFACRDEELAQRVRTLYGKAGTSAHVRDEQRVTGPSTGFPLPPLPLRMETGPSYVRVSALKNYLSCPYRYYLTHILGLKACHDQLFELDALAFGGIAHDVLHDFAQSSAKNSADEDEIRHFLDACLTRKVSARFAGNHLPLVGLQLQNLRKRLERFAHWQALWRASGWEIRHAEHEFSKKACVIRLENTEVELRARVDRIDFNPALGEWAIFDYKTSDKFRDVEKQHRRGGAWIDLQLPAYRFLALRDGFGERLRLAYISISSDLNLIGESWAEWTEHDFNEAHELLMAVLKNINEQRFWPPSRGIFENDIFSYLCGTGQFVSSGSEEQEI